ncbi:MAG: hypothetical protein MUC64_17985 [Rubritepida sp.]|jgi:hypothetical protein|nr:hypothetical protein [Rubritepida sp.]
MRLGLALLAGLLAGPALAHHGERHPPPNQMAQNDSIQELQRSRARPETPPGVQAQRRDAADADAVAAASAAELLRAAATAIRAGRPGQANELLERAESRLLTRSTFPARAGEPVTAGPIGHTARARQALLARNPELALREVQAALALLPGGRGRAGR